MLIRQKKLASNLSEASIDWSNLPPEILHLISKKLDDIVEFVRFRAVCKQWRCAALLSDPPLQLPWLVNNVPLEINGEETIQISSFSSGKTHSIHVPVKGPLWPLCTGYLLAQKDKHSFSLINPFTNREEIPLPILDLDLYNFRPVCHDQRKDCIVIFEARLENTQQHIVGFCRPDDETWKITKLPVLEHVFYCLYYDGRSLFLHDSLNEVVSVDAITGSILFRLPVSSIDNTRTLCFVFNPLGPIVEFFGEVLAVRMILGCDDHVRSFEIYRLDLQDDRPDLSEWVKTSNIGDDRMLFFDYKINCLSARTSDSSRLKGNSLYFFERCKERNIDDDEWSIKRVPSRYDISNGSIEFLSSPLQGNFSWMMPSLHFS